MVLQNLVKKSSDFFHFGILMVLHGVATIVQGTVVQGDSCPRNFCPMTQLSKQTFVQGDFCPRSYFDKVKAAHIIFFTIQHTWMVSLIIKKRKINLSKLFTSKRFLGQKSPWTKVCLDNCVIGQKSLGQLSPWTTVPWTNVATP